MNRFWQKQEPQTGDTKLRKATHTESVIFAATLARSVKTQEISEMVIGCVKPQNKYAGSRSSWWRLSVPEDGGAELNTNRSASQGSWEAKDTQSHEVARRSREPKCREYLASTAGGDGDGYGRSDGCNLIKLGGAPRTQEKYCATSDPNLVSRIGTC
jgi:hypothetical protein